MDSDEMYEALTVAKWFVAWAEASNADLSNLKLQKLLYYAHGYHLANRGRPLFQDDIQAWSHGPVVRAVYRYFKHVGSDPLLLEEGDGFDWPDVDENTTQFLISIWEQYGGVAAWKLRNMTHEEAPWHDHFEDGARSTTIPNSSLEKFFLQRVG